MRITSLKISNFRSLELLELDDLRDFVVIAGANGAGKSTILDALRLLKSSYVSNEAVQWMSEFGIDASRRHSLFSLLRDPEMPARIEATFALAEHEQAFLETNLEGALQSIIYRENLDGEAPVPDGLPPLMKAGLGDKTRGQINEVVAESAQNARDELSKSGGFVACLTISPDSGQEVRFSELAVVALTCFAPGDLGELDFHSSSRVYARQGDKKLNARLVQDEPTQAHLLYQPQNKYQNLKAKLTDEFVRARLSEDDSVGLPLQDSIQSLVSTFFPGKRFVGISLDPGTGELRFDIELRDQRRHDIDELSSGEKEIVYGYLSLRSSTPRFSIVLIDEPELHLNPALAQGLPSFYRANLAKALDAQVWVVTHSDAVLRRAAHDSEMDVFHVEESAGAGSNQATRISADDALESAILDLVGDLAAYKPKAPLLLVEGSSDTQFDVDVIRALSPKTIQSANVISAGNRQSVGASSLRLRQIMVESNLTAAVVSICDSDAGDIDRVAMAKEGRFYWPVYEIENFLLTPRILRSALEVMTRADPYSTDDEVIADLRELASSDIERQAAIIVQQRLNDDLTRAFKVTQGRSDYLQNLIASAESSQRTVAQVDVSRGRVTSMFDEQREALQQSLESDFLDRFPGGLLIRNFAGKKHGQNANVFKNVCIDQARNLGFVPQGLQDTIDAALEFAGRAASAAAGR